jgi:hypothetical protein
MEAIIAALRKVTILEPTAEPKMFAASFAPSDHPRKSPLVMKKAIMGCWLLVTGCWFLAVSAEAYLIKRRLVATLLL